MFKNSIIFWFIKLENTMQQVMKCFKREVKQILKNGTYIQASKTNESKN